jgi:predicted transcriptional regulator of viral defense system
MKELDMAYMSFHQAANRLIKKGKLQRLRGEFYVVVPPEYAVQGAPPTEWFIGSLMNYLEQDYYVALLSAAGLQGATHQLATAFQIVTNKVTPAIQAGRVQINFFYKKKIKPGYYQKTKASGKMVNVSIPEITVCDLLRYKNVGSINFVATILCEMGETLDPNTLIKLLVNDDVQTATVQRLGYLLELLEIPIDLTELHKALKSKAPQYHSLVPGSKAAIFEKNKRWHILVNENVEPDEL